MNLNEPDKIYPPKTHIVTHLTPPPPNIKGTFLFYANIWDCSVKLTLHLTPIIMQVWEMALQKHHLDRARIAASLFPVFVLGI